MLIPIIDHRLIENSLLHKSKEDLIGLMENSLLHKSKASVEEAEERGGEGDGPRRLLRPLAGVGRELVTAGCCHALVLDCWSRIGVPAENFG